MEKATYVKLAEGDWRLLGLLVFLWRLNSLGCLAGRLQGRKVVVLSVRHDPWFELSIRNVRKTSRRCRRLFRKVVVSVEAVAGIFFRKTRIFEIIGIGQEDRPRDRDLLQRRRMIRILSVRRSVQQPRIQISFGGVEFKVDKMYDGRFVAERDTIFRTFSPIGVL